MLHGVRSSMYIVHFTLSLRIYAYPSLTFSSCSVSLLTSSLSAYIEAQDYLFSSIDRSFSSTLGPGKKVTHIPRSNVRASLTIVDRSSYICTATAWWSIVLYTDRPADDRYLISSYPATL